jgi:hypothetical protein
MSEYKAILSGKPQQLISKFHISYALILNLLKNGQKTNFHTFSEKSMIYTELIKSINAQEKYINELTEKATNKREFIDKLKTPYATCVKVISIEGQLKTLGNKKKKDAERELRAIQDEYRTLNDDLKQAKEFMKLNGDLDNEMVNLQYMRSFVRDQTSTVCQVLVDDGFIERPHRKNMFSKEVKYFGIAVGDNKESGVVTIIKYVGSVRDREKPFFDYKNYKYQYPILNEKLIKSTLKNSFQYDDEDAPDGTISVKITKHEKHYDGKKLWITKKIYSLSNGSQEIVEIEDF